MRRAMLACRRSISVSVGAATGQRIDSAETAQPHHRFSVRGALGELAEPHIRFVQTRLRLVDREQIVVHHVTTETCGCQR